MAGRVILVATVLRAAVGFVVVRAAVVCERGVSGADLLLALFVRTPRGAGDFLLWALVLALSPHVRALAQTTPPNLRPVQPKHPFAPRVCAARTLT